MIPIRINQEIIDEFYEQIEKLFKNNLKKNKNKNKKWSKSLDDINTLLKKKLTNFDKDINLERLVKADYTYLQELVNFLDSNPKRYIFSKYEKEYFFTMYERLKKADFVKKLDINANFTNILPPLSLLAFH